MARFFAFCFVAIIVIDIYAAVMQQFSNQVDANTIATLMRVSSFTVLLLWYVLTFSRLTKAMKNHHNYEYERDWRVLWANFIT
jgi:membrane protein CcdC involved in cytochrome C biogenesis